MEPTKTWQKAISKTPGKRLHTPQQLSSWYPGLWMVKCKGTFTELLLLLLSCLSLDLVKLSVPLFGMTFFNFNFFRNDDDYFDVKFQYVSTSDVFL